MAISCPVDENVLFCVVRYEPEVVLLFVLACACGFCLWKFMADVSYGRR
jgi:hypothetical protein